MKSKQRVMEHGEVFTSEREVNAMLDLVKNETLRIDSRFLEPACGTGNFLVEILNRKLKVVFSQYKKSQVECEENLIIAAGSIYGIDILEDNVIECRKRLFAIIQKQYRTHFKGKWDPQLENCIKYILGKNIVCGDATTMKTTDGNPIIFSEWSLIFGGKIKQRVFSYNELINERNEQTTLLNASEFNDLNKPLFVPSPVKEYPAIYYKRLNENE